eukprot:6049610-Prymnesium_polylepis.2
MARTARGRAHRHTRGSRTVLRMSFVPGDERKRRSVVWRLVRWSLACVSMTRCTWTNNTIRLKWRCDPNVVRVRVPPVRDARGSKRPVKTWPNPCSRIPAKDVVQP